jgi:hypothetical protein
MADQEFKIKVSDVDSEPLEELEGLDIKVEGSLVGTVTNFVKQVVRLQFGLVTLPLKVLPAKTRYHAKNTLKEGFLTVRSAFDGINNTIENGLTRSIEHDKARAGE